MAFQLSIQRQTRAQLPQVPRPLSQRVEPLQLSLPHLRQLCQGWPARRKLQQQHHLAPSKQWRRSLFVSVFLFLLLWVILYMLASLCIFFIYEHLCEVVLLTVLYHCNYLCDGIAEGLSVPERKDVWCYDFVYWSCFGDSQVRKKKKKGMIFFIFFIF